MLQLPVSSPSNPNIKQTEAINGFMMC